MGESANVTHAKSADAHSALEETATLTDVPFGHSDGTFEPLTTMSSGNSGPDRVLDWLADMSAETPILFVIEDIQWADPTTLELLFDFVRRAPHNRVLFVMTCRDTFETPWASHHNQCQISLRPLPRKRIQALLEGVASRTDYCRICQTGKGI